MTPNELLDVYKLDFNIIGKAERLDVHKTVQCRVMDSNFLYFQIRGKDSDFAALLDVTTGDHIESGETEKETPSRESIEEIGFSPELGYLNFVKFRLSGV